MSNSADRESEKRRIHAAVNNYVECMGAELDKLTNTFHIDFIDGITREVGYGLENILFDEAEFQWSIHGTMIGKLRDAEIGVVISAVAIASLACRSVTTGDQMLVLDAAKVYPGAKEFADEIISFISGGMFTPAGKTSNVLARTSALVTKFIHFGDDRVQARFTQKLAELSDTSASGALHFANKGKASRDFSSHVAKSLPEAFKNLEKKNDPSNSGCGCLLGSAVIALILWWWFH